MPSAKILDVPSIASTCIWIETCGSNQLNSAQIETLRDGGAYLNRNIDLYRAQYLNVP